jgi:hypothetical protein
VHRFATTAPATPAPITSTSTESLISAEGTSWFQPWVSARSRFRVRRT